MSGGSAQFENTFLSVRAYYSPPMETPLESFRKIIFDGRPNCNKIAINHRVKYGQNQISKQLANDLDTLN